MRVVVTGGAGFIGHHLVSRLVVLGHDVLVLDNLQRASFERQELRGAKCVEGDIRCLEDCRRAFQGAHVVVHLAAQSNVMGSETDPAYTYETNVCGTWNVARAVHELAVSHLIFASSREVYGDAEVLPVKESAPLRPYNLYGATKVSGEVLLRSLPSMAPRLSILRFSNVIGRGDSGRVIPRWLQSAREGEPLTIFGGHQVLDLVPVDFACAVIERVIANGPLGGVVNVGTGSGTRIVELAHHIVRLLGSRSPLSIVPPRGPEVTRFCADTQLLRSLLHVEPPNSPLKAIEADW